MSNISVSAYLRTAQSVQGQADMGNDLLMARVDLTPMLDGHVSFTLASPERPDVTLGLVFSTLQTNGTTRQVAKVHST